MAVSVNLYGDFVIFHTEIGILIIVNDLVIWYRHIRSRLLNLI